MTQQLSSNISTQRLKVDGTNYTGAAGTTDLTSEAVDTSDCDGVRFTIGFGAITSGAVTSVKARQGAASNMSDGADLEGSAITIADTDDNKVAVIDIYRPRERYVDIVTDRGTQNAVVDFLIVEKYGMRKLPPTEGSMVVSTEKHASPAEGTA